MATTFPFRTRAGGTYDRQHWRKGLPVWESPSLGCVECGRPWHSGSPSNSDLLCKCAPVYLWIDDTALSLRPSGSRFLVVPAVHTSSTGCHCSKETLFPKVHLLGDARVCPSHVSRGVQPASPLQADPKRVVRLRRLRLLTCRAAAGTMMPKRLSKESAYPMITVRWCKAMSEMGVATDRHFSSEVGFPWLGSIISVLCVVGFVQQPVREWVIGPASERLLRVWHTPGQHLPLLSVGSRHSSAGWLLCFTELRWIIAVWLPVMSWIVLVKKSVAEAFLTIFVTVSPCLSLQQYLRYVAIWRHAEATGSGCCHLGYQHLDLTNRFFVDWRNDERDVAIHQPAINVTASIGVLGDQTDACWKLDGCAARSTSCGGGHLMVGKLSVPRDMKRLTSRRTACSSLCV